MKILLMDSNLYGLDFALRCKDAGHDVRLWLPPKKGGDLHTIGDGMVDKPVEWKPSMNWADLIVLTDNSVYRGELKPYFDKGYPIFGTPDEGAQLELDREKGQQAFEDCGIDTLPFETFTDYDKAIKHVIKTKKAYACKPWGGASDKALSYVASTPEDMVFQLEKWKKDGLKGQFMLQEKIDGIEMGVSGWFGPSGFLSAIEEDWEEKKLMNDGLGVNTGEQGCYSADTEVLTKDGWKYWPDVVETDELATLVDGATVFERPSELVSFDVNGDMVMWKNRSLDILVTPNHNMYLQDQHDARTGGENFKFVPAEDCTKSQYAVKRTAKWNGVSPEFFTVPGRVRNGKKARSCPAINVPFTDWCWFLGIYLAEGSCSIGQVNIAQSHPVKSKKVEAGLSKLPFKFIRRGNGFVINSTALAKVLKPYGRSYEKWIPEEIKSASIQDIKVFLDAYALGDGHTQANGSRMFYTSNPRLADDLQELMLRVGGVGIIKQCKPRLKFGKINGREIIARRPSYVVYERMRKTRSWLDARDRSIVKYKGKVYCATVSSHVLFVRRNGKPVWCGNTILRYVKESKLFDELLSPLEDYLHSIDYVGNINVNAAIDKDGKPWPFEFTTRLGWPATHLEVSLHQGDPAEWMLDCIEGRDTLEVSDDICVGVVLTHGDYPNGDKTGRHFEDYPVRGITTDNRENLHFCEMKEGKAPAEIGGTIKDVTMPVTAGDYVLVTTGCAGTVKTAADIAYDTIWEINGLCNRQFRTDIGKRLKKELPKLQAMGYAIGMEY